MLLGGYLLGGLDDEDQEALDAHLITCASCRDELVRLGPVPELLQRVPDAERALVVPHGATPSQERIDELLQRMRAERVTSRRTRTRILAAAAACVAVLAVTIMMLLPRSGSKDQSVNARHSAQPSSQPSAQVSAEPLVTVRFVAAAGSALAGEAVLTPKTWGVSVAVDVSRLPGDGPFVMQVRDAGGAVEQAACWGRTPTGRARVTGASSMQLTTVQSVVVTDEQGRVLGTARLV
jgi:hypothetical protein